MPSPIHEIHDAGMFASHVLSRFFADMHHYEGADNYDAARYSSDGVDRSRTFDTRRHVFSMNLLLTKQDRFFQAWSLLGDEDSKRLFIDLLRFQLAGHLHVRLPTNAPEFWGQAARLGHVEVTPSVLGIKGPFGPPQHCEFDFEGEHLKVDGCAGALLWPFAYRQYFYEKDGVRIRPERGDHVIDAGACMGETCIAFAQAAGAQGCVYAFDLLDSHLEACRLNFAQNENLSRFKLFACGLSDTVFEPAQKPVTAGAVNPGFSLIGNSEMFPTDTLDRLLTAGDIPRVDFIKMDIEGSEFNALRGAAETIRRFKPRLAISIYHNLHHFYEVPLFLDALGLGYKFHLGHYTIHGEESILYADAGNRGESP